MDVGLGAAGRSGSGYGLVCPKQETTLRQSIECHSVCAANADSGFGGIVALQPLDSAKVQLGGDTYDYPRARQFIVYSPQ